MNKDPEFFKKHVRKVRDEEELIAEYEDAIDTIVDVLDSDRIFKSYHPLQATLANAAPWSLRWIIDFASTLEKRKSNPSFLTEILPRLSDPDQFTGAHLELRIAEIVQDNGHSVNFVEREPQQSKRTPDLLVDSRVPLEITALETPDHVEEQSTYFREITDALFLPDKDVYYSGRILRELSKPEKEQLLERIEDAIPQAERGEVIELSEEGVDGPVYELLIAPTDEEELLRKWKEERNLNGQFVGPGQSRNEVVRIKRAIAEKVSQLPTDILGALLIRADPSQPIKDRHQALRRIAREVQKDVQEYPNLVSLIIMLENRVGDEDAIEFTKGNTRISDYSGTPQLGKLTFLVIHNKFADEDGEKEIIDDVFISQN